MFKKPISCCNKLKSEKAMVDFLKFFVKDAWLIATSGIEGWNNSSTLRKAYTAALGAALLALLPMGYDFYTLVRAVMCIAIFFFFSAARGSASDYENWKYVFIGLIVLYNPIFPVRIGSKELWTLINLATLLLLYKARLELDREKEGVSGEQEQEGHDSPDKL